MIYDLVLVEWEDAANIDPDQTWVDADPLAKYEPVIIQTIGFLIYEDEHRLVLTADMSDGFIGPRTQLPRGMIRKIQRLKVSRA